MKRNYSLQKQLLGRNFIQTNAHSHALEVYINFLRYIFVRWMEPLTEPRDRDHLFNVLPESRSKQFLSLIALP